jgi:hypothetical protein
MIYAEATPINQTHLSLVLNYPDGRKNEPVTVNSGEALRLIYFYNRLYITDTLIHWFTQRYNAYLHVNDTRRFQADMLAEQVGKYRKASLHQLCQWVIDSEDKICKVAPGTQSRYYNTYQKLIIPIMKFSKEMKGIES